MAKRTEPRVIPSDGVRYSKEQLESSVCYRDKRDLIQALLDENKNYTKAEADEIIEKYMKGKVE